MNACRFALFRKATTVGEFFELHPGTAVDAAQDLKNGITRPTPLCVTPGFTLPKELCIAAPCLPKAARARASGKSRHACAVKVPTMQGAGADDPPLATE